MDYDVLKCSYCGGELQVNEVDNTLKCHVCGSVFSNNSIQNDNLIFYSCQRCNIDFQLDDLENKKCIYCGNELTPTNKFIFAKKYIPFEISKDEAIKNYKKCVMFNPFLSLKYKMQKKINNMDGYYIPITAFDFSVEGNVLFNAMDTKSWSDKEYKYKEINKYTNNFKATGDIENVYVSRSNKINEEIFSYLEPYDFTKVQDFLYEKKENYNIQNSNIVEDLAEEEAKSKVNNEIVKYMRNFIDHQKKSVSENSLNIKMSHNYLIYIPIWIFNVDNNLVFMNGQTGKIYLEKEIKISKIILYSIAVFILLFILSFLIASLL